MNNTVDTKTAAGVVVINNPTCYCPDAIIAKHIKYIANDTVGNAITSRMAKDNTAVQAAQDLFTRAVRYEEYYKQLKCIFCIVVVYNARNSMRPLDPWPNIIANFIINTIRDLVICMFFQLFAHYMNELAKEAPFQYSI